MLPNEGKGLPVGVWVPHRVDDCLGNVHHLRKKPTVYFCDHFSVKINDFVEIILGYFFLIKLLPKSTCRTFDFKHFYSVKNLKPEFFTRHIDR